MVFLQQSGKQKHSRAMPRVPDGVRIYAIGDIHGCADLLENLQQQIMYDARLKPLDRKILIYLGDYVDRGPDSFKVIESLISPPFNGFETVRLKGNHEDMLLDFIDEVSDGHMWLMNGGLATLESYGIDLGGVFFDRKDVDLARRLFIKALAQSHMDLFRSLDTFYVMGDYFFVHAGINPDKSITCQKASDLMWIRHEFLDCLDMFEKMIVHGHSIHPVANVMPNRIGIDTGAHRSGCLTCLVLEGDKRRFLHT